MMDFSDYYLKYIKNEGYEIIKNDYEGGVLRLISDTDGKEEYYKEYNSKEELDSLLLTEKVVATENMINIVMEDLGIDIPYGEKITIDSFINNIDKTKERLLDIVKQLEDLKNVVTA
ncbi:MAG: hypothetical protein IJ167_03225 [Lachnospiraceae bacterium]|nr:hypothetical protein [Lachnospiraceae bacterium]